MARNNFEGGTNGAVVTTGNAGGTGNTQFNVVNKAATATCQYFNGAAHGGLSVQLATAPTPGSGCSLIWNTAVGSQTTVWIRFYIFTDIPPVAAGVSWRIFSAVTANGASLSAAIEIRTDGRLAMLDGTGTEVLVTAQPINANNWNRIEAKMVASATVGQIELRLFRTNLDSTVPDESLASPTNRNVPTPIGIYDFGHGYNVRGNFGPVWIDDLETSTTNWIGPAGTPFHPASVGLIATPTLSASVQRIAQPATVLIATPTLLVQASQPVQFGTAHLTITPLFGASLTRPVDTSIWTRYPYPPQENPFRLIAQDILTGVIVDWDLPVQPDFSYTTQLSGPTIMSGAFPPEIVSIQELGLDGYAYFFHVEVSGEIRATGIFLPPAHDDTALNFTCEGISSIPHYITWGSEMSEVLIDPLEVVRRIWTYVQSNPRSNVGVIVSSNTSNQTVGIPAYSKIEKNDDGTTFITDVPAAPYELKWWEAPNCGDSIDNLCTQTPFDYKERASWNTGKTNILKYYDMAFPRLGSPRDALLFDEDNVLEVVPIQEGDDTYASEILVIGAGEGSATIRGYAAENFGGRIRKMQVVTDKTVTTVDRANSLAVSELGLRKGRTFSIDELVIHARHENATIGEYDIGDDIFVKVIIPWLVDLHAVWYRILSISYSPAQEIVRLKVARSDSFTYSNTPTPPVTNVTDDVRAAQDILNRMTSGDEIFEDWTWTDCPLYVSLWNDRLIYLWQQAGSPSVQAWLQAYIIARI